MVKKYLQGIGRAQGLPMQELEQVPRKCGFKTVRMLAAYYIQEGS